MNWARSRQVKIHWPKPPHQHSTLNPQPTFAVPSCLFMVKTMRSFLWRTAIALAKLLKENGTPVEFASFQTSHMILAQIVN